VRRTLALLLLAANPARAATDGKEAPPVYVVALPASVSLIAWLPVKDAPDQVVLDLRVEVVEPANCGDRVAGLLHRGARGDEHGASYDVVVERRSGACTQRPARIGARTAIRFPVADGARRRLEIGPTTVEVARDGGKVTLDGQPPQGDVPGAPPTARPTELVMGSALEAKLLGSGPVEAEPLARTVRLQVKSRAPSCAGAPIGLLARGDASTRFALLRFEPLARVPQDEPCRGDAVRTDELSTVLRPGSRKRPLPFHVGEATLELRNDAAPRAPDAKSPAAPAKPGK
jgi:hypothetical protein